MKINDLGNPVGKIVRWGMPLVGVLMILMVACGSPSEPACPWHESYLAEAATATATEGDSPLLHRKVYIWKIDDDRYPIRFGARIKSQGLRGIIQENWFVVPSDTPNGFHTCQGSVWILESATGLEGEG